MNTLKFFDARGRVTRTVGRQGGGPGEFEFLQWVKQCEPDSLFAYDMMKRSISVFSATGQFVRQFLAPGMPSQVACSRHGVLALLSGQGEVPPPAGAAVWRVTAPLRIADARGRVTRELGIVLALDLALAGRSWMARPGGFIASMAVGRDRVFVCPTDSGAVAVYGLGGARGLSIPLNVPARVPTRRHLEASADAQLVFFPTGAMRDSMRVRLLRVAAPSRLPSCSRILTDTDDNVWVVTSMPGDSVTQLRSIGRNGRVIDIMTLSAGLEILEVGSDYLLASGETAAGEPFIRVYRIRRGT